MRVDMAIVLGVLAGLVVIFLAVSGLGGEVVVGGGDDLVCYGNGYPYRCVDNQFRVVCVVFREGVWCGRIGGDGEPMVEEVR